MCCPEVCLPHLLAPHLVACSASHDGSSDSTLLPSILSVPKILPSHQPIRSLITKGSNTYWECMKDYRTAMRAFWLLLLRENTTQGHWGREGLISSYSSRSRCVSEGSKSRNSREKPGSKNRSTAYWFVPRGFFSLLFLYTPGPPAQRWHHSWWTELSLLHHESWQCLTDMHTGQYGRSHFSIKFSPSQTTLACVHNDKKWQK